MVDAVKTLGAVLAMSAAGSPQSFTTIGNVTDFNAVDGSRNIIPTSNLSSDAATKMAGLLDEGNASFTINLDPDDASHVAVRAARDDGQVREFKITLPNSGAAELHFNGIVTTFPWNGPFDDKVTTQVGIAITGRSWVVY